MSDLLAEWFAGEASDDFVEVKTASEIATAQKKAQQKDAARARKREQALLKKIVPGSRDEDDHDNRTDHFESQPQPVNRKFDLDSLFSSTAPIASVDDEPEDTEIAASNRKRKRVDSQPSQSRKPGPKPYQHADRPNSHHRSSQSAEQSGDGMNAAPFEKRKKKKTRSRQKVRGKLTISSTPSSHSSNLQNLKKDTRAPELKPQTALVPGGPRMPRKDAISSQIN